MFANCPSLDKDISIGQIYCTNYLRQGAYYAMSRTLDRYKGLKLAKVETSGEPESRPGYQEESVHFVGFQPGKGLLNVDTKPRITRTHVLQKSKYKNRQHLQIIRNR